MFIFSSLSAAEHFVFPAILLPKANAVCVLNEHTSVGVNPEFWYHFVPFILITACNLMIYTREVTGSHAK